MPVFDFTNAKPPEFELIPEGAVVTVSIHIRGGGVGDEGLRKRGESEKGVHEALDLEFVVLDGPHKGKRFWDYLVVEGTGDGQKKMAVSNMHTLKLLLDSALGLDPKDESPEARAARTVSESWFEGRVCMVKIGKQKGGQPGRAAEFTRTATASPR